MRKITVYYDGGRWEQYQDAQIDIHESGNLIKLECGDRSSILIPTFNVEKITLEEML